MLACFIYLSNPYILVVIYLICSFDGEAEHSIFFESLNGGKKNIVLDLKNGKHKDAVKRLDAISQLWLG